MNCVNGRFVLSSVWNVLIGMNSMVECWIVMILYLCSFCLIMLFLLN